MLSQTRVFIFIVLLLDLCTTARPNASDKKTSNPHNPNLNIADSFAPLLPNHVHVSLRPDDYQAHPSANNETASTETPAEPLPQPERLANPAPLDPVGGKLPEFPQRPDAVYFIVAVAGGAKVWGRTLARTLIDMGAPFDSPLGPPLRPLYVDIPPNGR